MNIFMEIRGANITQTRRVQNGSSMGGRNGYDNM